MTQIEITCEGGTTHFIHEIPDHPDESTVQTDILGEPTAHKVSPNALKTAIERCHGCLSGINIDTKPHCPWHIKPTNVTVQTPHI